jgi:hypothetical protein
VAICADFLLYPRFYVSKGGLKEENVNLDSGGIVKKSHKDYSKIMENIQFDME